MRAHDDVLEQFTEAGLDGALVADGDLQIVRDRSDLTNLAIRLREHEPRAVAVLGTRRIQLLERAQPRRDARDLLLGRPELTGARVAGAPRGGQLRFPRHALQTERFHRIAGGLQPCVRRGPLLGGLLGFDAEVLALDIELGNLLTDPAPGRRRVLHRMAQRRRGVHGGEYFAARRLDVPLEPFDAGLQIGVGILLGTQIGRRLLTIAGRPFGRLSTVLELEPRRLAACVERCDFGLDFGGRRPERLDLMPVESDLLLQPPDRQLPGMRELPRFRFGGVRLGQLQPERLGGRLDFGEMRGGTRFALARLRQLRASRLDRAAERAIPLGELHLLPPPQLLPQAAIAAGLGRLTLQRAALLLDLEHDVVDPGEVLLRRLQLQLRRPPPALVLGHTRGLFDQLPPIGGPGAEDLADLPLLDHRVALDADARIHQEILDVLETAGLAVDQVLALARSIETAHQLDVPHDQRRLVLEQRDRRGRRQDAVSGDVGIGGGQRQSVGLDEGMAVAIPVAVAVPFPRPWPFPWPWCLWPLPPSPG